jgi:hypothetical protein
MKNFLDKVADFIIDKHGNCLEDVVVIMPGKRSGIFLQKALQNTCEKGLWMPEIMGINDFMINRQDLEVIDQVDLIFEAYHVYSKQVKNADDFNEFINWAPTVLNDFDDIDRYLVDPDQIFMNLKSVRELEGWELDKWSFDNEELKPLQLKFLTFWDQLKPLYFGLNEHLHQQGKARTGLIYRRAWENFTEDTINPDKHYYFVGLNALSKAETSVIKKMQQSFNAQCAWDYHSVIINDPVHEANFFMQKNLSILGKGFIAPFENEMAHQVTVHPSPSFYSQASIANALINADENNDTALILCDENLLEPVQLNLPQLNLAPNITTELPITKTLIHNFFQYLLQISIKNCKSGNRSIYHLDLSSILQHPAFKFISISRQLQIGQIVNTMSERNMVYISHDGLQKLFGVHTEFIENIIFSCKNLQDTTQFIELTQRLLLDIKQNKSDHLILEQCYHEYALQTQILEQINRSEVKIDLEAYKLLMRFFLKNYKLSFVGEPLSGLQIMGMLETRSLNFKKLIFAGANEGTLPQDALFKSFIPYDLRRYFGLPGKKNKEAIHAYYFYRLIWPAEEVHLIYNANQSGNDGAEPSRYVLQLKYQNQSIQHESSLNLGRTRHEESVNKTPEILELTKNYLDQGLSSSAIGSFLNCPLDFFHKSILRLYEQQEVEEDIQASTLGTILHEVLQSFYEQKSSPLLQLSMYEKLDEQIDELLKIEFLKVSYRGYDENGKNRLAYDICKHYLKTFLTHERNSLKKGDTIEIVSLEGDYMFPIELNDGSKVVIKGKIDRIDRLNGNLRVIDYKSGAQGNITTGGPEVAFTDQNKDKERQLLIYAWLVNQKFKTTDFTCSLLFLRDSVKIYPYRKEITNDLLTGVENSLRLFCENLLNPDIPFEENLDPKFATLLGYPQ